MERIEAFKTQTGVVLIIINAVDQASGKLVPVIHQVAGNGLRMLFGPDEARVILPTIRNSCDVQDLDEIQGIDIFDEDVTGLD